MVVGMLDIISRPNRHVQSLGKVHQEGALLTPLGKDRSSLVKFELACFTIYGTPRLVGSRVAYDPIGVPTHTVAAI